MVRRRARGFARTESGPAQGRTSSRCAPGRGSAPARGAQLERNQTETASAPDAGLNDRAPAHHCWPSDDFSTLLRANDRLGERVQRHVFCKKLLEHRPEHKYSGALKSQFVEGDGDFQAPSKSNRAGRIHAAHNGQSANAAQSFDLLEVVTVVAVGV